MLVRCWPASSSACRASSCDRGDRSDERVETPRDSGQLRCPTGLAGVPGRQQAIPVAIISAQVGPGAAAEERRAFEATAGLAADDRLALPDLRAGSQDADPRAANSRSPRSSTSTSARSRRTSSSATARSSSRRPARSTARSPTRSPSILISCAGSSASFPAATSTRSPTRCTTTARRPSSTGAARS